MFVIDVVDRRIELNTFITLLYHTFRKETLKGERIDLFEMK